MKRFNFKLWIYLRVLSFLLIFWTYHTHENVHDITHRHTEDGICDEQIKNGTSAKRRKRKHISNYCLWLTYPLLKIFIHVP